MRDFGGRPEHPVGHTVDDVTGDRLGLEAAQLPVRAAAAGGDHGERRLDVGDEPLGKAGAIDRRRLVVDGRLGLGLVLLERRGRQVAEILGAELLVDGRHAVVVAHGRPVRRNQE